VEVCNKRYRTVGSNIITPKNIIRYLNDLLICLNISIKVLKISIPVPENSLAQR
jgi:hypothetical protein